MKSNKKKISIIEYLNKPISKKTDYRILSFFLKQLSTLLNANIPVNDALYVIKEQRSYGRFTDNIHKLYENTHSGVPFSEALARDEDCFFPKILVALVKAGEQTGNLAAIIDKISDYYDKEYENRKKIQNALTYPIILIIVTVVVIFFIINFVMPTFLNLFESTQQRLPLLTRFILSLSGFIVQYNYVILAIVIAILFLSKLLLHSDKIRYVKDRLVLRLPLFGSYRMKRIISIVSNLLGIMLSCNVPIMETMDILIDSTDNLFIKKSLQKIAIEVESGADMSQAFIEEAFYPTMFCAMLSIGENSGELGSIMLDTSEYYLKDVEFSTQKLVSIIEPALIIFMSLIVGTVVLAIAIPMFDMINYIQ